MGFGTDQEQIRRNEGVDRIHPQAVYTRDRHRGWGGWRFRYLPWYEKDSIKGKPEQGFWRPAGFEC